MSEQLMFLEINDLKEELETMDYMLNHEIEKNMILEAHAKMTDTFYQILEIRYHMKYHS